MGVTIYLLIGMILQTQILNMYRFYLGSTPLPQDASFFIKV